MPHNRGRRRNPRYVGVVLYKGHKRWVGTHRSVAAYRQAASERLSELREEIDLAERLRVPTVTEFAGAVAHPNGQIMMVWPEGSTCVQGDWPPPMHYQTDARGSKAVRP